MVGRSCCQSYRTQGIAIALCQHKLRAAGTAAGTAAGMAVGTAVGRVADRSLVADIVQHSFVYSSFDRSQVGKMYWHTGLGSMEYLELKRPEQ